MVYVYSIACIRRQGNSFIFYPYCVFRARFQTTTIHWKLKAIIIIIFGIYSLPSCFSCYSFPFHVCTSTCRYLNWMYNIFPWIHLPENLQLYPYRVFLSIRIIYFKLTPFIWLYCVRCWSKNWWKYCTDSKCIPYFIIKFLISTTLSIQHWHY